MCLALTLIIPILILIILVLPLGREPGSSGCEDAVSRDFFSPTQEKVKQFHNREKDESGQPKPRPSRGARGKLG